MKSQIYNEKGVKKLTTTPAPKKNTLNKTKQKKQNSVLAYIDNHPFEFNCSPFLQFSINLWSLINVAY